MVPCGPSSTRARHDVPLLGTCGGFQHVVIEYARNVLGIADAQHAEHDPYASTLLVTPLSCSLAGQALTVEVRDVSWVMPVSAPDELAFRAPHT